MSLFHETSPEGIPKQLMLFNLPPVDTCTERMQIQEFRAPLSDEGPLDFSIPSTDTRSNSHTASCSTLA